MEIPVNELFEGISGVTTGDIAFTQVLSRAFQSACCVKVRNTFIV